MAGAGFQPEDPAAAPVPPVQPNLADPARVTPGRGESTPADQRSAEVPILPEFSPPTSSESSDPDRAVPADSLVLGRTPPDGPPEGTWRFDGVYLLTTGPDGPTAVPGLILELGNRGVGLWRADGAPVWIPTWDEITELSAPERSRLPGAGHGVVVLITATDGRAHRFVIPTASPGSLEASLNSLARRRNVSPERPERSQPAFVVIGALIVLAAALALLLLSAGHIVSL